MNVDELIKQYPRLFHMAEAGSWESVRAHGLLSTTALLDLFGTSALERQRLESQRRPKSETIEHPEHGTAVIRDQIPLREGPLEKCLSGMTVSEWYEELNGRVFFWVREERLNRLLRGRAYRDKQHDVLTVDTASLVEAYREKITLAPINTGSTIFKPQPRGVGTFLPIDTYPYDEWRVRRGGPADAVVELAVDYAVPDVKDHTRLVETRRGETVLSEIWRATE